MTARAPDDYSFAAWKAYCDSTLRIEYSNPEHDPERLRRLDRILATATDTAWRKLANDITRNWPEHLGPMTWREALHNVAAVLTFPPNMIPKPDTEKAGSYLVRMRRAGTGIPLLPGTRKGANTQRNWVALYLKTRMIPALFNRQHYEEIATLVEIAWESGDGFSAPQVRLIRPFHFRKTYRQKSG